MGVRPTNFSETTNALNFIPHPSERSSTYWKWIYLIINKPIHIFFANINLQDTLQELFWTQVDHTSMLRSDVYMCAQTLTKLSAVYFANLLCHRRDELYWFISRGWAIKLECLLRIYLDHRTDWRNDRGTPQPTNFSAWLQNGLNQNNIYTLTRSHDFDKHRWCGR